MEMLDLLQPRISGSIPVEAKTEFRQEVVATNARMMCPFTCGCSLGTAHCVSTGNSQFVALN